MKDKRKAAYSLIELVLVLAVVSILAALWMGVFGRVREPARRTHCQANMRQIFVALQTYMQDSDSRFPTVKSWTSDLMPYVGNAAVFRCPSVSKRSSDLPASDYGAYPKRVAHLAKNEKGWSVLQNASEAAITNPQKWILMSCMGDGIEALEHRAGSLVMLSYPKECARTLNGTEQLGRDFCLIHSGGSNYLFADGHVKWLTPDSAIQTDCDAGPFLPRVG